MKAREIMTFSPEAVLPDDTVAQAARVMHELTSAPCPSSRTVRECVWWASSPIVTL
jgi:CBS domain-containing protein